MRRLNDEVGFVEAMGRSCDSGDWETVSAGRSAVSVDDRGTGRPAA
jgi:hypothetical protein